MVDKLAKALDGLKNLQFTSAENKNVSKKEKMFFCFLATDIMVVERPPNINYLPILIENLVDLCNDDDSDVRMVADESLNRIIMSLSETHMPKVQLELHKIIKKNGPARCLRAALNRFGQLSQYIRPNKGRVHIQMLVPSFLEICKREEEMVHETLASSFDNIFKVLGVFIQDNDLKTLIKAFLHNLSHTNPVIRRCSAICIIKLVQYCRKPHIFNSYVLNLLIDCVVPICEENSADLIIGVLGCLRLLIPNLILERHSEGISGSFGLRKPQDETFISVDRLIQIYELALYYTKNKDHNVVTAALETLYQILQKPPQQLEFFFLSTAGFSKSYIQWSRETKVCSRSGSELSVACSLPSVEESLLIDENELSNHFHSFTGKEYPSTINFIPESKEKFSFCEEDVKINDIPFRPKALGNIFGSQAVIENDSDTENSITSEANTPSFLIINKNDEVEEREVEDFIECLRSNSLDNLFLGDNNEDFNNSFTESDIGSFTDAAIPLIYCVRHLVSSFLLDLSQASVKSDRSVRVSIKSLALSCVTAIVKLYPIVLKMNLIKSQTNVHSPKINDILHFSDHGDPQIRGYVQVLIGSYIRSTLIECKGFESNILNDNENTLNLENLICIILEGLSDKSSLCNCQSLSAVKMFLNLALKTPYSVKFLPLLEYLPVMMNNSYWLVKVKLVEVLSELPYFALQDLLKSTKYQEEIIDFVLLPLLGDENSRVRTATAEALVRIVPLLCSKQSPLLDYTKSILSSMSKRLKPKFHLKHYTNPCVPFSYAFADPEKFGYTDGIEYSLSTIVSKLTDLLIVAENKYFLFGYLEALKLLSEKYPTTVYLKGWNCWEKNKSSQFYNLDESSNFLVSDLIIYVYSLIVTSPNILDLKAIGNATFLLGNLFAGHSILNFKNNYQVTLASERRDNTSSLWNVFKCSRLTALAEEIFIHLLKVLNLYSILIEEVPSNSNSELYSIAAQTFVPLLSPLKKQEKKFAEKTDEIKGKMVPATNHSIHYLKLQRLLKNAYTTYKGSLEKSLSDKFLACLESTLYTLSILLEMSTVLETRRCADEILYYMKNVVKLKATPTIICVNQLLKSLFGTNLVSNWKEKKLHNFIYENFNLFDIIFKLPSEFLSEKIHKRLSINSLESDNLNGHHGRPRRKFTLREADKNWLAMHIRLFEPMVVKSLQLYTTTGNVILQSTVLQLLNQLIQLRVNYCLLDEQQVYVEFVLKQFELIEQGLIPQVEFVLPHIFKFLILLSYEKQHSKPIISIPKILQLCDGLMASNQPVQTHCIPAFVPIVEDLFILRNPAGDKEAETQREVLFSMLLRVAEFPTVMDLLTKILTESKSFEDKEKWKRWSKQIVNVVLNLASHDSLQIETLDDQNSLVNLMSVLSPIVLRPIDPILKVLFVEPKNSNCCTSLNCWLSKITVFLDTILIVKEDVLLNRLEKVSPNVNLSSFLPDGDFGSPDPFNIDSFLQVYKPSEIVSRFLIKTLAIIANRIVESYAVSAQLQQKLSMFFICIYHIVKSGTFHKISNSLKTLLINESECFKIVFSLFKKLSFLCPLLTCQFSYLLTLLNYNDQIYWKDILSAPVTFSTKLVQWCGVISLADYLCDNISDVDTLHFLITNNFKEIVLLSHEIPVGELLSMIRQKSSDWSFFMEVLPFNMHKNDEPCFIEKLLRVLETTEKEHSVKLLRLLISKYLTSPRLGLSLLAGSIACRQVELLLTLPKDKVLEEIDENSFKHLMEFFGNENYMKRHFRLWSLLNKLGTQIFESESELLIQTSFIQKKDFDQIQFQEDWFFSQVKNICCQKNSSGSEIVMLLSKLNVNNVLKIFACEDFNLKILKKCLIYSKKKKRKLEILEEKNRTYNENKNEDFFFEASKNCVLRVICEINEKILKNRKTLGSNETATEVFNKISSNGVLCQQIWDAISTLTILLTEENLDIKTKSAEELLEFGLICLQMIVPIDNNKEPGNSSLEDINLRNVTNSFDCCAVILKNKKVKEIVCKSPGRMKLQKFINHVYQIIHSLVANFRLSKIKTTKTNNELSQFQFLFDFVLEESCKDFFPEYLLYSARHLVITLCRIPDLSSKILRVPETGDFQDIECFDGFIRRFSLLGWASKQQFEEIWVALLAVLGFNTEGNNSADETGFIIQASAMAIEGITSLLKNTLLDSSKKRLIHHGRDIMTMKNIYENLPLVQTFYKNNKEFSHRESHFLNNLEVYKIDDRYFPGLFSIEYLWTAVKQITSHIDLYKKHSKEQSDIGLDLPSCIYFLTELYGQWMFQASPDIKIITSSLKSSIILSDLFTDISQFQWLLNFSLKAAEIIIAEDTVLLPLVILACAKAAAVILPDFETCEKIKKLMLRSTCAPCRVATVQGLLYLLQSYVVCYTVNHSALSLPGSKLQKEEVNFVAFIVENFLPVALDIVQHFKNHMEEMFEEYNYCYWSLTFYLLQNYQSFLGDLKEDLINFIINTLGNKNCSETLMSLLVRGIERLLLTTIIDDTFKDQISKVAINIICQNSVSTSVYGLQLLMILSFLDKRAKDIRQLVTGQEDPENMMKDLEKINTLFEKLKKSYPKEAKVVGDVLSYTLMDFTASDVLTKVIHEFLLPQHPYQKILAGLLYKVFERAELNLLEDWVVCTLPNFIRGMPISMSVWVLNCFFLSASSESWLRYLFPLVQSRIQMAEDKDKNLLCLSGLSFYNQLKKKSQKTLFIETLEKVSKLDAVFADLLSLLK